MYINYCLHALLKKAIFTRRLLILQLFMHASHVMSLVNHALFILTY
jgi:hypothetical protein